jgi:tRNA(fMet)-specific endonuclease VapC
LYLLDTDHITILENGHGAECDRLRSRLADLGEGDVAATIISFEEQTRGWLSYLARARSLTQQVEAYARLRRMVENYRWIPLIDFDSAAAAEFQRLKRSRLRIGTMDLKIAAIALAQGATLLSRNRSDFEKVPGLIVEDWTA